MKMDRWFHIPTLCRFQRLNGMSEITRHNLYNSSEVTGAQAPGYSSGQALQAIQEVAQRSLPKRI